MEIVMILTRFFSSYFSRNEVFQVWQQWGIWQQLQCLCVTFWCHFDALESRRQHAWKSITTGLTCLSLTSLKLLQTIAFCLTAFLNDDNSPIEQQHSFMEMSPPSSACLRDACLVYLLVFIASWKLLESSASLASYLLSHCWPSWEMPPKFNSLVLTFLQ